MPNARELLRQIRLESKPLDKRILRHLYLSTLEAGQVPRDALKVFAGQQYHIITSDLRSIALTVSRHGTQPSYKFLLNVLQGEAAALDALHSFARALAMSGDDLEGFEPLSAAHAYCAFVAWLALYRSDAELGGAFLTNSPTWGANCRRMSKALKERYSFAESDLAFFDLFANMPPFEEEALAIIQAGLDRGIHPRLIHRAARLLQGYELMFWDAMAEAAGTQASRGV